MAQYKTRRMQRYNKLRTEYGFMPFEAQVFSKTPFNVPYMKQLIKERKKELKAANKAGLSTAKYQAQIKKKYIDNKFTKSSGPNRIKLDPWQLLRDQEEKFKLKNPMYDSPWKKKQRNFRDYMSKVEKTIAKQTGIKGRSRQGSYFD